MESAGHPFVFPSKRNSVAAFCLTFGLLIWFPYPSCAYILTKIDYSVKQILDNYYVDELCHFVFFFVANLRRRNNENKTQYKNFLNKRDLRCHADNRLSTLVHRTAKRCKFRYFAFVFSPPSFCYFGAK